MHRIRLTLCALMLAAGVAHAGIEKAGTTTANFLSLGTGASVLSMGGASLGTGGSLQASAWNPAALGQLAGSQYSVSHAALAMQSSQDWLAAGGRIRRSDARWSVNAVYQNDGDFQGYDAFGAPTGSFNASNLAMGAHVARPFGQTFVLGAGLQWVNEYLGQVSGSGLGFDAGVLAHAGALGVGAVARNVGGKMRFDSGSFDMPQVFGIGASWASAARGLRFNLDANFPNAYYNDVRMGAEWMWQNRVALRTGYRMELNAPAGEPVGGPSFGMGAGSNSIWVDYAFLAGAAEAQGTHRMSFSLHPGFMNPGGLAMAPTPIPSRDPPVAEATAAAPRREAARAEPRASAPAPAAPVAALAPAPAAPVAVLAPAPAARAALPAVGLPLPTAKLPAKPAETPVLAQRVEPAPPTVSVVLPEPTLEVAVAARTTTPATTALRPAKAVRVPKLAVPRLVAEPPPTTTPALRATAPAKAMPVEPAAVVAAVVAAPRSEAVKPAASEPVKLPAPVSEPVRASTQVASNASAVPVVVRPAAAPSTEPIPRPAPAVAPAKPQPRPASVAVQAGESLADIARRWSTSVPALMMENNLVTDQVKQGQKLKLPPPLKK